MIASGGRVVFQDDAQLTEIRGGKSHEEVAVHRACHLYRRLSRDLVDRHLRGDRRRRQPGLLDAAIGFFTDFLDTLGIGSFATTSALFKLGSLVPDEQIPGTLNVGHTLPTITEAFIYVGLVRWIPSLWFR